MKATILILILLVGGPMAGIGQQFVNLDFEDAVVELNNPDFGFLDWDLAAPGWSHSSGMATEWVYYRQPQAAADSLGMALNQSRHVLSRFPDSWS